MANDHNIKNFTALDIEKYHTGQLSAKEMHDLEKAALDDPFLADALEGYSIQGINISHDISELKKRLAGKTEPAKVIPIISGGSSSFPWLRAAAIIVLIAGGGLLSYQYLFNPGSKDNEIAKTSRETVRAKDSADTLPQANGTDTFSGSGAKNGTAESKTVAEPGLQAQKSIAADGKANRKDAADSLTTNFSLVTTDATATAPAKTQKEEKVDNKLSGIVKQQDDVSAPKGDIAKNENKPGNLDLKKPADKDADGVMDMTDKTKEVVVRGYATSKRSESPDRSTNYFRGRVTDANNNALPFANITNTRDNVGTYSDAQGKFTLISADTVLNVQVRSLGFEDNNALLRNYLPDNQVMLQEDRSLDARVLDTVKRNISRSRNNTLTFEEPEPEDGWPAYRSYVVNNLNIPETYDIKKTGETAANTVEVSFDVNKNGDPVNIKVEKSLCDKCDKEAIRLIKEGPKWKRKAKKTKRTSVTVPFIKVD